MVTWECVPKSFFPSGVFYGNNNVIYTAEASGDVQVKDHRFLLCLKGPFLWHKHILCRHGNRLPTPTAVCFPLKDCSSGTLEAEDLNYRVVIPADRQPCRPPWSQTANYLVVLVTRTLNQDHQFIFPSSVSSSLAKGNSLVPYYKQEKKLLPM